MTRIYPYFALAGALVCLATLVAPPLPSTSAAGNEAEVNGARKINLAARQMMLTQRIARSACFAAVGIDVPGHLAQLGADRAEFERVQTALERGSPELRLTAEQDPTVTAAFRAVDEVWRLYVVTTRRHPVPDLSVLLTDSIKLLHAADDAVALLDQKYDGGGVLRPGLSSAIAVAGRQRMLLEKMSKELCVVVGSKGSSDHRSHLLGTIALFRSSDAQLRHRLGGLALGAEATDRIAAQHAAVDKLWAEMAPILDAVAAGGTASRADLELIARDDRDLMTTLEGLVAAYEAAA
jgi:hypothetical protein